MWTNKPLLPKRSRNLTHPPINLHLSSIHILINSNHALRHLAVLLLTLLEHLENKIAADARVICVAKVFINALLEGFDAFAEFLCVLRVDEFLEDVAGVGRALRDGLGAGARLGEKGLGGLYKFLEKM